MTDLGPVAWPPARIRTERLVLREPEARDRAAVIELLASPEVGTYLGGPRPRDELELAIPGAPSRRPGLFIVDLDGAMIGQITLTKDTGHLRQAAGKAELGWFAGALPGEPVVLATQTANVRSMRLAAKLGFIEVERFEAYGAEQWFGIWSPVVLSE